jgi:hypothetical protein
MNEWLALAASRSVVTRALKIALVVGTILGAINHGDKLLLMLLDPMSMALSAGDLVKIVVTYLVPYSVSTYSSVQTIRNLAAKVA